MNSPKTLLSSDYLAHSRSCSTTGQLVSIKRKANPSLMTTDSLCSLAVSLAGSNTELTINTVADKPTQPQPSGDPLSPPVNDIAQAQTNDAVG